MPLLQHFPLPSKKEAQTGFEPVNQGVADQQKNPRTPLKLWGISNVSTLFPPYSTKFKPSSRAI